MRSLHTIELTAIQRSLFSIGLLRLEIAEPSADFEYYPESKGRDFFHDRFTNSTPIQNGKQQCNLYLSQCSLESAYSCYVKGKTWEEITEAIIKPHLFSCHEKFSKEMYEASNTSVHFVYGGSRREFLDKA